MVADRFISMIDSVNYEVDGFRQNDNAIFMSLKKWTNVTSLPSQAIYKVKK